MDDHHSPSTSTTWPVSARSWRLGRSPFGRRRLLRCELTLSRGSNSALLLYHERREGQPYLCLCEWWVTWRSAEVYMVFLSKRVVRPGREIIIVNSQSQKQLVSGYKHSYHVLCTKGNAVTLIFWVIGMSTWMYLVVCMYGHYL